MNNKRIEKGIEILKWALSKNLSVGEASKDFGYAYTYLKNTYRKVKEGYKKDTDKRLLDEFFRLYSEYKLRDKNTSKKNDGDVVNITTQNDTKVIEISNLVTAPTIKTLEELLKKTEVDLDVWKVKSYIVNKWDVTSWKKGFAETAENFQVKATLIRVDDLTKQKFSSELFKKMIKDYKPPQYQILPKNNIKIPQEFKILENENNMLELSLFDLHIGKLAWAGETGENYDVKIASKRFINAIIILLNRASRFQFNKILFPIGNDFFNSDNQFNTTTKGTIQDEDLRWQKTFTIGTRLIVDAINLLKQTGVPIEVMVIPGNHDFERSYYLGSFIDAWFHSDDMVNVNNGASPRKYYKFGKNLLGFTHGNNEKEAALPMLMATENSSNGNWGNTKFHEFHLGHTHRKRNVKYTVLEKNNQLTEDLGVTVRYLSSLTGTEEWHHSKGFIGQIKAADGFLWNSVNGMIAHIIANVDVE
jgi:hypothetical protein